MPLAPYQKITPKPKQVIKHIIKFFANLLNNIFAVILVGIVGLPVLISWATGTLDTLLQSIKTPMPIWATIILVLLVLFYIKIAKSQEKPPKNKTGFVNDKYYRWEVTVKPNGNYEVHDVPFCITHDRVFVKDLDKYICTHDENGKLCTNSITEDAREAFYKSAVSLAEKEIRTKKIKLR